MSEQGSNNRATALGSRSEKRVKCDGYPIRTALDLLLPELLSIKQAIDRKQIEGNWQTSHGFHRSLWRNFKEEHYLTRAGLSDVDGWGVERFNEVHDATFEVNSMIDVLDVLRSAANAIKTQALTAIESTAGKFGRLLQRLPQELLSETIRYACSDIFDLIKFSHVNRRFRQAALGISSLWSRVSSDMPIDLVRLCLERSGNSSLYVVFNEANKDYSCEELEDHSASNTRLRVRDFTAEVSKFCTRWKNIELRMPLSYDRELQFEGSSYSLYLWLTSKFGNLHLPRLESLSIKHRGCLPDDRGFTFVSSKEGVVMLMYFYTSWKASNLRSLSFTGLIPAPIQGASIEGLVLDMRVGPDDMNFSIALHDLLGFLAGTPSLQTLSLHTYHSGEIWGNQSLSLPTTVLEKLKTLTLNVERDQEITNGDIFFNAFVRSIRLPNLSSFSLSVSLEDTFEEERERDVTDLVNSLIPDFGAHPRIENFSLFVYDCTLSAAINLALDKYPYLRSLEVRVDGDLCVTPESRLHPNVKRSRSIEKITLVDHWNDVDDWLSWIAGELRDGGGLEKLNVVLRGGDFSRSGRSLSRIISPARLEILECEEDRP
ncbi:hypothetical protein SCHPADRAFT_1000926 [Schizopora paradoxa]|uniref:F-box domain-containing protein n=1 Tax=Schizopora paradoxa TaxID=27342 RepID=A0A0H2RUJ8_9AGAM|nr:hypothetical protein SCHPADRAFT_1000926 [Schizopora paradoxa]